MQPVFDKLVIKTTCLWKCPSNKIIISYDQDKLFIANLIILLSHPDQLMLNLCLKICKIKYFDKKFL